MNKIVRIQIGHYARTRGATGAWNASARTSEQSMNKALADEIVRLSKGLGGVTFEIIGADDRPGGKVDIFIAFHMDGAASSSAKGGSFGYLTNAESRRFAAIFKKAYENLGLPSNLRNDNYTSGLRNYYGYKSSYSGWWSKSAKLVFENGFLTNSGDLTWAKNNRTRVAQVIIDSCLDYLGLEAKPPTPPTEAELALYYKSIKTAVGSSYSREVKLWQELLNAWGADGTPLVADGLVGPRTEAAHKAWSKKFATVQRTRPGKYHWRKLRTDPADFVEPPTFEEPSPAPEPMPEPVVTPVEEAPQGVWPRLEAALALIDTQTDTIENLADELAELRTEILVERGRTKDALAELTRAKAAGKEDGDIVGQLRRLLNGQG